MRLEDYLMRALDHGVYVNVGTHDHHDQPENIEVSNTTLSVQPLPGGPGVWEIDIPDEATLVMFSFRSNHTVANGGAKAGVIGVANDNSLHTTAMGLGGHGTLGTSAYNHVYAKPAAALNLSDKIFSAGGDLISLTEAYITGTVPNRKLRTEWTNYGASTLTLNCWGQIAVIG